jgi:antitoxin HicB
MSEVRVAMGASWPDRIGGVKVLAYDFKVLLEPDETGGYVVSCPSLPGCYTQGDTIEAALANIREAIELCLEDLQAQGETLPDPSGVLVGSIVITR